MKNLMKNTGPKLFMLAFAMVSGVYAFAQDAAGAGSRSNTTVNTTHTTSATAPNDAAMWYMNPVVWVIAALLLFALILGAMIRGRNNQSRSQVSRVTTTTTTLKSD